MITPYVEPYTVPEKVRSGEPPGISYGMPGGFAENNERDIMANNFVVKVVSNQREIDLETFRNALRLASGLADCMIYVADIPSSEVPNGGTWGQPTKYRDNQPDKYL